MGSPMSGTPARLPPSHSFSCEPGHQQGKQVLKLAKLAVHLGVPAASGHEPLLHMLRRLCAWCSWYRRRTAGEKWASLCKCYMLA